MGASNSTAKPDGSSDGSSDDEEPQQPNNNNNRPMRTATVMATAAAGAAVAAWGIFDSSAKPDGSSEDEDGASIGTATAIATAAAGAAVAAWSISRMLSDNTRRYKMNTDGSCPPGRRSGYGGILRDHHGKWVRGFIGFIGVSDSLTSEFHGILKGLELLDKLKLKGSILETDSEPAYLWVTRKEDDPGKSEIIRECWDIISDCKRLAATNNIDIKCVSRKANKCANKLAQMAVERKEVYVEFNHVPSQEISDIVEKDAYNYSC